MNFRQALVIGAARYPANALDNAADDAVRVAQAFRARSFEVVTVLDPDAETLQAALDNFKPIARTAELAAIFLAGHAVERHGSGYFLPIDVDFPLQPARLAITAFSLNAFVEATEGARSRIVVLDACRNWPEEATEARRVLADLDQLVLDERSWRDLLLAYSTSAATQAGDGASEMGSVFSAALCRHLRDHSLTVDECFRRVSQDVLFNRRGQQPWTYSSLAETLSFSDLPRFSAVQRHAVPNPEQLSLGAWTAMDAGGQGVILGVGDAAAWTVSLRGIERGCRTGKDRLMGAADTGRRLLLAGSEGALYEAGVRRSPVLDLDMTYSHGVTASPLGETAVYYGAGSARVLRMKSKSIKVIASYAVDFEIYASLYLPDGPVWIAGEHGRICELDPTSSNASLRDVAQVCRHVNMMAVAPSGD